MAVRGMDMLGLNCKPKASGLRLFKRETPDPLKAPPSRVQNDSEPLFCDRGVSCNQLLSACRSSPWVHIYRVRAERFSCNSTRTTTSSEYA